MLFNTLRFAEFFAAVYPLYLVLPHRWQNRLLLAASYWFYGSWDWRFLSLVLFTTAVDYGAAMAIQRSRDDSIRRRWLALSIVSNLTVLGFFKYYNFFAANLAALLRGLGFSISLPFLNLILPWGISFYTFQSMSYTIDVYWGELVPASDFLDFSLFVTFFPHLVAGPIMRATTLLPQVLAPREVTLEKFYEGCHIFFWGLFQKTAVADNLAPVVDAVFRRGPPWRGADVVLGAYAFAFQIYGDFAGYSNMARGLGKMMGFEIMVNFDLPFFSTNPAEYWRRWHISLSTWLRDYLFTPLVLAWRDHGELGMAAAVLATFLLAGLWHGAAWHFVAFGGWFGVLIVGHQLFLRALKRAPGLKEALDTPAGFLVRLAVYFHLALVGQVLFRAPSLHQSAAMLAAVLRDFGHLSRPDELRRLALALALPLAVELHQFRQKDLLAVYRRGPVLRAAFYLACWLFLTRHGAWDARQFIYFQF